MKAKPKILITNDDGIFSSGIYALWEALSEVGDVYVVAPSDEKSAASHSITINNLLRVKKVKRAGGFEGWSVSGTPADCTKIAVKEILKFTPDLLVSGINVGSNLGNNIMYSGTIAAAVEGAILNIPSIAISLDSHNVKDWSGAKIEAVKISKNILRNGIPQNTILNVNVPYCNSENIKGIKITNQGNQYFKDEFEKRNAPSGFSYYWMKGKIIDRDTSSKFDGYAVSKKYTSITPITFKFTDTSYLNKLVKLHEN